MLVHAVGIIALLFTLCCSIKCLTFVHKRKNVHQKTKMIFVYSVSTLVGIVATLYMTTCQEISNITAILTGIVIQLTIQQLALVCM